MALFRRRPTRQNPDPPAETHQKIDRLHFLRRCSLFAALSEWELQSIAKLTRLVEVKREEIVSRAGEPASAFHIVLSGKFEVFTGEGSRRQVLAYLKQGSYFGEMSLIADQPHSATVAARSDSLVLEISKENFKHIVQNNAAVSLEISRALSRRLKEENERSVGGGRTLLRTDIIGVQSTHHDPEQTSFSVNLAVSLHRETGQSICLVDMSPTGRAISDRLNITPQLPRQYFTELGEDLERTLKDHLVVHETGVKILNLASREPDTYHPEFVTHLMNRLAVDFRFVVVDFPEVIDDAVLKIMTHCEHLFIITSNQMHAATEVREILAELDKTPAASEGKIKVVVSEQAMGFALTPDLRRELFEDKECFMLPKSGYTSEELRDKIIVVSDPESDYARRVRHLARKVSNNLVGLALGSGAALGFSHIGVLKVLEREKIPIDMIAGSSMGALVASFYAIGKSSEEMEAIAAAMSPAKLAALADISIFPIKGLIKGHRLARYLSRELGHATFEQTRTPLIIVGANIHDRRIRSINSGPIIEALMASIAIPGIIRPVKIDGETLIDGGILDPLPVRPLQEAGVDKIIAVDVLPTPEDIRERRRFLQLLGQTRDSMVAKKNILTRSAYWAKKKFVGAFDSFFVDIVVNSMQAMEHEIANATASDADVLIRPSVPQIHWAEFHRSKELIIKGEEAAQAMIPELRALVKQQNL
jgi:NTE family protein